jgi:hypothetical protein
MKKVFTKGAYGLIRVKIKIWHVFQERDHSSGNRLCICMFAEFFIDHQSVALRLLQEAEPEKK